MGTVAALRAVGHEVEYCRAYDETMGHAGAIVRHPNGTLEGGGDPRSDGAARAGRPGDPAGFRPAGSSPWKCSTGQ